MYKRFDARTARARRHRRLRLRIAGSAGRPRLSVFRSSRHIYAQIIDDNEGRTLVAASSNEAATREQASSTKVDQAGSVGQILASRAREQGITRVVFDRGGYLYHGRVKALADSARQGGLEF